jgi:cellulose synthase/poly-beta-1,6-N-acetylglucosamine synthase-like glycosyltransferase
MTIDILSLATFSITIVYFLIGFFIHVGLSKKYQRTSHKPKVTVLIAARNEEATISSCLDSLWKQDYPAELLQIIVINDRSSDNTRQIILEHKNRKSILKLIDISQDLNGLMGKMNALAQGIDHADGEIILVTDADCRVPVGWITEMVSYFTEKIGLVGSLTVIAHPENEKTGKIFDNIQTLDWFFLQAIASGTAGIYFPVSVLGNNFGFRKSVYDVIGGFASIGFSLTEDMALLNSIIKKTDYKIAYPLQSGSMIQSLPLNHIRDFFQQRKRWLFGGKKAPLWGWILMFTSFIAHLLIVLNLALTNFTIPVITGFAFIAGVDLSLIWRVVKKSGSKKLIRYFIPFEVFYFFYSLLVALTMILPGKIYWKERSFNKTP